MDDRRLRVRLRSITDVVEPRREFVDELHDTLAGRLGFPLPATEHHGRRSAGGRSLALIAATVALAVALVGGGLLAGALIERWMHQTNLFDLLRERGEIRVAVRSDDPQVIVPGGALAGFDIDVVRELGDELGLNSELRVTPIGEMLAVEERAWDVAMPSTSLPASAANRFRSTQPYYYWPFYVVIPRDSEINEPGQLAGATLCLVAGSAGEAWLAPSADRPQPVTLVLAPADVTLRILDNDDSCLADVASGASAALVTAGLTRADLGSRPDYRIAGDGAAGWEGRAIIVPVGNADGATLVAALDEAILALRADGTLRTLSQSRFGGEDLSIPPR